MTIRRLLRRRGGILVGILIYTSSLITYRFFQWEDIAGNSLSKRISTLDYYYTSATYQYYLPIMRIRPASPHFYRFALCYTLYYFSIICSSILYRYIFIYILNIDVFRFLPVKRFEHQRDTVNILRRRWYCQVLVSVSCTSNKSTVACGCVCAYARCKYTHARVLPFFCLFRYDIIFVIIFQWGFPIVAIVMVTPFDLHLYTHRYI